MTKLINKPTTQFLYAVISLSFLLFGNLAYATQPLVFSSKPQYPQTVVAGTTSTFLYKIQNNTPQNIPITIDLQPSSLTVATVGNTCGNGNSGTVPARNTCTLPIIFQAPSAASSVKNKARASINSASEVTGSLTISAPIRPPQLRDADIRFEVVASGSLTANSLVFTQPGNSTLTLTNNGNANVSINGFNLVGNLFGVSLPSSVPPACQSLAPQASCNIIATAANNAYGNGAININYSIGSSTATLLAPALVSNTVLTINNGQQILLEPNQSNQTIAIRNSGNFDLDQAAFSLNPSLAPQVTLSADPTCASLPAGSTCNLNFTTSNASPGSSSTLNANANNLSQTQANVIVNGGVTVSVATDANLQHLQYKALKITNTSTQNATLNSVQISSAINDEIQACFAGNTSCEYISTCSIGATIAPQTECLVWLKANEQINGQDIPIGKKQGVIQINAGISGTDGTNTVVISDYAMSLYAGGSFNRSSLIVNQVAQWDGSSWMPLEPTSTQLTGPVIGSFASYQGDLYVGGFFNNIGSLSTRGIARWDGVAWNSVGEGLTDPTDSVRAMQVFEGKLYAGGSFSQIGNVPAQNIAVWDGNSWSPLAQGTNEEVFNLGIYQNKLYVVGIFTTAGGVTANAIAAWDGSNWSALGAGLTNIIAAGSLTNYQNQLIAGGTFTLAGGVSANRIAAWNGNIWTTLGLGIDGTPIPPPTLFSLAFSTPTQLYVAGRFTTAGGNAANNIASWNGSTWSPLISGGVNGVDDLVYSLLAHQGIVYAGGNFTNAGDTNAVNRIASWDGNSWSRLGEGFNNSVFALFAMPSLTLTVAATK